MTLIKKEITVIMINMTAVTSIEISFIRLTLFSLIIHRKRHIVKHHPIKLKSATETDIKSAKSYTELFLNFDNIFINYSQESYVC